MKAYCCECKKPIECELVNGDVIYPYRPDLYHLHFYKCPLCGNYTGRYDGERVVLPTKHIRSCRYKAHRALNKIWKDKRKKAKYYTYMSDKLGRSFHWGEVECNEVADKALELTLDFLGGEE